MSGLDYQQRLNSLDLFPVSYHRTRGDILWIRKIIRDELGPESRSRFPLRGYDHLPFDTAQARINGSAVGVSSLQEGNQHLELPYSCSGGGG